MKRGYQAGFFTLEILLVFTLFTLILMAFQGVFRQAVRTRARLEVELAHQLEQSLLMDALTRDYSRLIPLKDGRGMYLRENPGELLLRFVAEKDYSIPPGPGERGLVIVEHVFDTGGNGKGLLRRREMAIRGYDERVLERELKPDMERIYSSGVALLGHSFDGRMLPGWVADLRSLELKTGTKGDHRENSTVRRWYFHPFRPREERP